MITNVGIWWSLGSTSRLDLLMISAIAPGWRLWSVKRWPPASSFQSCQRISEPNSRTACARFATSSLNLFLFSQFSYVEDPCWHNTFILPRRCHCGVLSCPKECSDCDEEDEPSAHLSVNSNAGWLVVISLNCACTKCLPTQSFSLWKHHLCRGIP